MLILFLKNLPLSASTQTSSRRIANQYGDGSLLKLCLMATSSLRYRNLTSTELPRLTLSALTVWHSNTMSSTSSEAVTAAGLMLKEYGRVPVISFVFERTSHPCCILLQILALLPRAFCHRLCPHFPYSQHFALLHERPCWAGRS